MIAAVAISLGLATQSRAQDQSTPNPELVTAVKQLLATLEVQKTLEPALAGIKKMQAAMLDQQNLSEEEKKAAAEIMAVSMEEVEKVLAWESMEAMMIRIYSAVFTAEEIKELITLFESPTGQAYIKKQPELQVATMQEMQKMMVSLMPQIQEKTKAAVERAKAGKASKN